MASASDVALQAAIDGNLGLLKMMASKVNLREAKDDKGRNTLHLAAEKGHLEVCRFLVEESGLDVDSVATEGHCEAVRLLLSKGFDLDAISSSGTPLHMAASKDQDQTLKILLEHGADAGANVNFRGPIILMCAVNHGVTDIVKFLLEAGADPNISDEDGGIPIVWAAVHGLFGHGSNPVMPDSMDSTPPHDTADEEHCEAERLLLSKDLDVDAISSCATPLHMAASRDQDQILKILLEHGADAGADVNFRSRGGSIILMEAVHYGLTDIVKFLLEAGADPNIPDKNGRIPITWAALHGQRDLVELLFPWTKPILHPTDWSVDGIIRSMKFRFDAKDAFVEKELLVNPKSRGKEAFVNGNYFEALYLYGLAAQKGPLDATLYANLSICWLRVGGGQEALSNARECKMMRPGWSKAWYREGAALSFLKDYEGAIDSFKQALKLDSSNDEIKKALREATEAMRSAARSG